MGVSAADRCPPHSITRTDMRDDDGVVSFVQTVGGTPRQAWSEHLLGLELLGPTRLSQGVTSSLRDVSD